MGRKAGVRHRLGSSICTFALGSANGRNRPVCGKGSELVFELIKLILLMEHNLLVFWWRGSHKLTSQASGSQTEGQFICNENQDAKPGMFTPGDQIFVSQKKLYVESQILIRYVLVEYGVRGRGVKEQGPCFWLISSETHLHVWGCTCYVDLVLIMPAYQ